MRGAVYLATRVKRELKNLFNANADTVNIQDSSISGSSYTLTLTNLPKAKLIPLT